MIRTERKNKKKKKQATTKPPGESFSIDSPSLEKPLVIDSMAGRGGEGNRPPRRTLGDYEYQQGPKHYNNIVIPPFNNKVVELNGTTSMLLCHGWHGGLMCVSECHVAWHMYFVDPGQYISPPSSESACGRKRLSSVKRKCLMFGVVALTSKRVTSLSSPQAWTSIVQSREW